MSDSTDINVNDWITLSSVMIGAVLTILALIWQASPTQGIVSASFLLLISFIFFVNSVTTNSKAKFEAQTGKISEQKVKQWITFAEYSFGIGFTLVVCGFSILGYEYLMDFTSQGLLALLLPIVYMAITIIVMFTYNVINSGSPIGNLKRNIWAVIELAVLVLIILDFIGIIIIP
jgi:hypothetical protein